MKIEAGAGAEAETGTGTGTEAVSAAPGIRDLLRSLPVFDTELETFDTAQTPKDPVSLFVAWLKSAIAAGVREPHAMALATADAGGRPSTRVLICKDVEDEGIWYFASGAGSRKGQELAATPHAALGFYWPEQGRQITVRGPVRPADPARSAADFLARPVGSRAEAVVGRQSQVVEDPREVDAALAEALALLERDPGHVAEAWTLYGVHAEEVEFWQADRGRRHTRLRYVRAGEVWERQLLWS